MSDHSQNSGTVVSWKRVILWMALFLFLLVSLTLGWFYHYTITPAPRVGVSEVIVNIPKGASVKKIVTLLDEAGLVKEDVRFLILAKLSGTAGKLKAGEFSLPTGLTPRELLSALVQARPVHHSFTLPEGWNAREMGGYFEKKGWFTADTYLSLVYEQSFITSLGMDPLTSLEGYLFPDTYLLTRDLISAENVIRLQVKRFSEVWGELVADLDRQPERGKTVILASMVEKETGAGGERGLIAGVFFNRLQKGMRLQSDPTVVYGLADFDGKITKSLLKNPTPYNTYVIKGLPAGPIANPGKAALHAVILPTESPYLYFVSKNDGSHHFSRNLKEHNRAVRKYQRKKTVKSGTN